MSEIYTLEGYELRDKNAQERLTQIDKSKIKCNIHVLKSEATQDIILIQVDGKNILCDSGYPSEASSHFEQLAKLGANKIDYFYVSHYHSDHAGGIKALVDLGLNVRNSTFILPVYLNESMISEGSTLEAYRNVMDVVANNNITVVYPHEFETIELVEGITSMQFFNTEHSKYYAEESFDYNNCCVCAVLTHGDKKVFFSGDIALSAQNYLKDVVPHVDIAKVEHHALNAFMNKELYQKLSPEMCFSCNGTGHATYESLNVHSFSSVHRYLQRNGIPHYCSHNNDELGFVICDNVITHNNRAFTGTVTIEGNPALVSAIPFDKKVSSTEITLNDLILGMENGTFVTTKIHNGQKLWDLCSPFVHSSVKEAMIFLYKGASSAWNGSWASERNGYFYIIPSGNSMTTGFIYGVYEWPKSNESPDVWVKIMNPVQFHKFTKSPTQTKLVKYVYGGNLMEVLETGELNPCVACFYEFIFTIENLTENDETFRLIYRDDVLRTIKVPAGMTISVGDIHYPSANVPYKFVDESGGLKEGYSVSISVKSVNAYSNAIKYEDNTVTQNSPFEGTPYY